MLGPKDAKEDPQQQQTGPQKNTWEVAQIECGVLHSAVRTHGGSLYLWGCGADGQLGLGEDVSHYCWVPTKLDGGFGKVKEVVAGYEHCLAVTFTGQLWAWGKGDQGQLGIGLARDSFEPQQVLALPQGVLTCSAGEAHSAAIVRPGGVGPTQLYTWGSAANGMLGLGEAYMSGVHSTPKFVDLQLNSLPVASRSSPAAKARPALPPASLSLRDDLGPLAVRCGQSHTILIVGRCDLGPAGASEAPTQVWTFGGGWYGKLGHDSMDNVFAPRQVALRGCNAKEICCGAHHTCMLTREKELYVWGKSTMVCEQDDVLAPKKFIHIEGQPKVKLVVCGEGHTLVVTDPSSELYAWGENANGQLGLGSGAKASILLPEKVKFNGTIDMLATGLGHTVAKLTTGETVAWGAHTCGRLGLTEKQERNTVYDPAPVAAIWESIESAMGVQEPQAATAPPSPSAPTVPSASDDALEEQASEAGTATVSQTGTALTSLYPASRAPSGMQMSEMLSKQKIASFRTMQQLLLQEDPLCLGSALRTFDGEIEERMSKVLEGIKEVPAAEEGLVKLERDLEQSLRSNLRFFKSVTNYTSGGASSNAALVPHLPTYKEMVLVLQQQPAYLANLSMCLKSAPECEAFYGIVEQIFANPSDRTRHLFQLLLRLMVSLEIEAPAAKEEHILVPQKSRVFHVFSRYCTSPENYKGLVHQYFKLYASKADPSLEPTLLMAVQKASTENTFALTYQQYKDLLGDEDKKAQDEQELQSLFQTSLMNFRDFLIEHFVKTIVQVELPRPIRQFLYSVLQAVKQRYGREEAGLRVLLRVFFQGILDPLMRTPQKFASKECFLGDSAKVFSDPGVATNFEAIAQFMEQMIEEHSEKSGAGGKANQTQKILSAAEKQVKPKILAYLLQQANVSDMLTTNIMIDTYLIHFGRTREPVRLSDTDLMKLSNVLNTYIHKLRARENDVLYELCKAIPEWKPEAIQLASYYDVLHNFELDPRYLLYDPDIVLCQVCKTLQPRRLCNNVSSAKLVPQFQDEDPESSRRVLDDIFRNRNVPPLQAKDFAELKQELVKLREKVCSSQTPDYDLAELLQKGLRVADEMLAVEARPEDMLAIMSEALVSRAKHLQNLQNINQGLDQVMKEATAYKNHLAKWQNELKSALSRSLDLELPPKFLEKSGGDFKFEQVAKTMSKKRAFNPKTMEELGCSYAPTRTYGVNELRKMKVLVEVHPPLSAMQKSLKITFRQGKQVHVGGIEMSFTIVQGKLQNTIKTLSVPETTLQDMRLAQGDEQRDLGEPPVITCVCSQFTALVTKMQQETI